MANGSKVFDEVEQLLESGDALTIQQRDKLLLAAMKDLHTEIMKLVMLESRVKKVEEKSILLFAERHPKVFMLIVGVVLLLVNMWFVSDFRKAILSLLGLPTELVP